MRRLLIVAGVNGAGKSTLYESQPELFNETQRVNADEISRKNNWDWNNDILNLKAMALALKKLKSLQNEHQSINFETTLAANKKSYLRIINKAHNEKYAVDLLYIGLNSADLAIKRVDHRVSLGGHGIPESRIRERYIKSLTNLQELIPKFDNVFVFDNTNTFKEIYIRKSGITKYRDYSSTKWFREIANKIDKPKVSKHLSENHNSNLELGDDFLTRNRGHSV